MGSINGDVWLQLNQLRQKREDMSQINNISNELQKCLKFFNENSDLINTSNGNFNQINDLNDIKYCGIDLTNRSTDVSNETNDSNGRQSSDQSLDVLYGRQEVPEIIDSPEESEEDNESDYQQNKETNDGSVDENQDLSDRQVLETNEDINESLRDTNDITFATKSQDNDSDTEEYSCGASDKDVANESDIDCGQRVKRVKTSKDKQLLSRHQLSHSGQRYFCDHKKSEDEKCIKHFRYSKGLRNHKKFGRHVLGQSYKCYVYGCGHQTQHMDQLVTHMANHSISDRNNQRHQKTIDGKYGCDLNGCDKKFTNSSNMIKHRLIHLNRTYRCDVDGCGITCTTPDNLRQHNSSQHINKYPCRRLGCDYKTGNKTRFNLHVISHSNKRQFKCLINNCDQSFKRQIGLNEHRLRVHPNELPDKPWIQCTYTGCQFQTKCNRNLIEHKKKHFK